MRAVACLALMLAACQDSESATRDMIAAESDNHLRTIAVLEERITASEKEVAALSKKTENLQAQIDLIGKTMDRNAKVANDNTASRMTQRGACGTRVVRDENGTFYNQNIPCTTDDLRP